MDTFHVFYVNRGYHYLLQAQSGAQTVYQLQCSIHSLTGLKPDQQVLLLNNGTAMDSVKTLSIYPNCGSCDNPVFLYLRANRIEKDEMTCSTEINQIYHLIDDTIDQSMRSEQGKESIVYLELPKRARDCKKTSTSAVQACARMVQEHTLFQMGWTALINNLHETMAKLTRRSSRFYANLEKVQQQKVKAAEIVTGYYASLDLLKKIMIPPILIAHHKGTSKNHLVGEGISAFDWISACDTNFSLQDVATEVIEQLDKLGATDPKVTAHNIDHVVEQLKNSEYKEIKGINRRLGQLEHNLRTASERDEAITRLVSAITTTNTARLDENSLKEFVGEHRANMSKIYAELREIRELASLFHKSKTEVLNNLRVRLNGWIALAFDKLATANLEITMFEEKFTGLKFRLDLLRQVRDCPVVYATAVCEVIRRMELQKQFVSWLKFHNDNCKKFADEETKIRSQLKTKLENHFIRVLFAGLGDKLPKFYVENVDKFDQNLPPVDHKYLSSLRQSVQELEEYLRVTSPQVFHRLASRDPTLTSPSTACMRREESFFTHDETINMAALNRDFPSSNWLSEDNFDGSPIVQPLLMVQSPMTREASSAISIAAAPSLHQMTMMEDETIKPGSILAKSAPIQIPVVSPIRQMSEKSSQFSTPEDHFEPPDDRLKDMDEGQQFSVDDISTKSQSMDFLKPIHIEIVALSKDLLDIRAELVNNQDKFKDDYAKILQYSTEHMVNYVNKLKSDYETQMQGLKDNLMVLTQTHQELEQQSEEAKTQLEIELTTLRTESEQNKQENQMLKEEIELLGKKVAETKDDVIRKMTYQFELMSDEMKAEHESNVKEKEREMNKLKKELEKLKAENMKLAADPHGESFRNAVTAELRAELEKEYKSRTETISRTVEEKKESEITKLRKKMEIDLKRATTDMQFNMKWLASERDQLASYIELNVENGIGITNAIKDDISGKVTKERDNYGRIFGSSVGSQTDEMVTSAYPQLNPLDHGLNASQLGDMKDSVFQSASFSPEEEHPRVTSPDISIANQTAANEMSTQTKINLSEMTLMVTINNPFEGATVLVIWDSLHESYIIFSSSPYKHFVKESSVRRLGLSAPTAIRRSWILARITNLDLCIIRKEVNRYKLPINSRVYRVDVEAVPFDVKNPSKTTSA